MSSLGACAYCWRGLVFWETFGRGKCGVGRPAHNGHATRA